MNKPNKIALVFFVVLVVFTSWQCCRPSDEAKEPYLVVLSLDGFRWDYPQQAKTPVLDSLAAIGVHTNIIPSYPTKTFPNHYSMATGLYPDHHGIVLNSFHDPDLNKDFQLSDREAVSNADFYDGEPIWNTCERQGVTTATLFWVGSEAPVNGRQPTYWHKYDHGMPFASRIDSVYHWLSLPEEQRPHLVMWYYHEPDGVGHHYGPHAPETINEVETLDSLLGRFFTRMRSLPEFDQLNFIVTSDHGMGELSPERVILVDEIIDTADLVDWKGWNPVINVEVKEGAKEKVRQLLASHPHLKAYDHDSMPERLHYGTNPRTQDLTIEADSGYSIYWSWDKGHSLGTHGYDNKNTDMHAIFYAAGPAFKANYQPEPFANINLYPLMARIMMVEPAPVDGTIEATHSMLVP